jgi:hypothetical protein
LTADGVTVTSPVTVTFPFEFEAEACLDVECDWFNRHDQVLLERQHTSTTPAFLFGDSVLKSAPATVSDTWTTLQLTSEEQAVFDAFDKAIRDYQYSLLEKHNQYPPFPSSSLYFWAPGTPDPRANWNYQFTRQKSLLFVTKQ